MKFDKEEGRRKMPALLLEQMELREIYWCWESEYRPQPLLSMTFRVKVRD